MTEPRERGQVPKMFVESEELLVPTFELVSCPMLTKDSLAGAIIAADIAPMLNRGMTTKEAMRRVRARGCGRIRFVDITEESDTDA